MFNKKSTPTQKAQQNLKWSRPARAKLEDQWMEAHDSGNHRAAHDIGCDISDVSDDIAFDEDTIKYENMYK